MIVTPTRSPGRRRGELPFRSVPLDSIPAGTLTPLKEILRRQDTLKAGAGPAGGGGPGPGPAGGGVVLQSTLVEGSGGGEEPPDVSEILADPNPQRWLKRRACEPPARESPAKIFQRMKAKAQRDCGPPAGKAPPKSCATDFILTPTPNPAAAPRRPQKPVTAEGGRGPPEVPAGCVRPEKGLFLRESCLTCNLQLDMSSSVYCFWLFQGLEQAASVCSQV